ncbi:sensor histidine kinase KdpD [Dongia soli]|uniref:histidine kinase n=1 Tax=Dongia soli TaxID=600628 RepID=A0ABU5E7H3_9PROT|nr:sensor histidine kinase KdpD [Dongia soli]MDY0881585.1 sensor histidine kinase KdpD [Dongia soli]
MSDPVHKETERRPSADALLATSTERHQGRLKIFLGAAPGVGKTYEMLLAGKAKQREGVDVIVGLVETHGRVETQALLEGLEILPRKAIPYRDRTLSEMDLDAILARKPKLVLVDELAHTNVPGSRHAKRYQDVEEILSAGIDVYTTLNIQHLESLNDVVAQITHVRVRETLPDHVIDQADEVEVIDLTPKDLIQRLHEGKIYTRHVADRALTHYFSEGNLTALREMALRRTAQRVDEQMLSYMQAHAIHGPWAAGERIVVCINEHPSSLSLVRHARRAADRMQAKWEAIYIETTRHQSLSEADRDRIASALRLAEHLGGSAVTIPGRHIASDLIDYARQNNVTQIIIGKSRRSRWFEMLHGSVVHDLVRRSGNIGVHVVTGESAMDRTIEKAEGGRATNVAPATSVVSFTPYLVSTAMVALVVAIGFPINERISLPNISMVFLAAVLFSAIRYGLWPSLFASLLSTLAYNFFFLRPLFTLTVSDPSNIVALIFFLIVAVLISQLAARVRLEVKASRQRAASTAALYGFSRKIAAIGEMDDLLWATAHQIASMLKLHVILLLPEEGVLQVRAGYPPEDELNEADLAAATWAWTQGKPAGRDAETLPGARRLFLPLRTERGLVGVMGIDREQAGPLLTPDERRLLDAISDQAAIAIERINLATDIDQARVIAETERLRSALLTSISHDLRTPLSSIIGSVTSLRSFGKSFDGETRDELLLTIQEEAERLNRFVGNILDMTKLESGSLRPKDGPVDPEDTIFAATRAASRLLTHHRLVLEIAPDLPLLRLDSILFGQVLFNLLDNAAKYAPHGTAITIRAQLSDDNLRIQVMDEGPGIPPQDLERIFDKFFRVHGGDRRRAGTGLGLAICRGFVEAMGGQIFAENRPDRSGACIIIAFPGKLTVSRSEIDQLTDEQRDTYSDRR